MAGVGTWSTTAGSNNSVSPDGFPENMAPSGVNDSARELMAALATWYADHAWVLRGTTAGTGTEHTVAYASATTFTTAAGDNDTTATYHAGRRIKCTVTAGTVVGRIASSTGDPTTVTVTLDSGSLDSGLSAVYLGPEITNPPIDASGVARSALNLLTTQGDALIHDGTSAARLAVGTAGQILTCDGTDPSWGSAVTESAYIDFTSGSPTIINWTSIPSWVTNLVLVWVGADFSTNNDDLIARLGTSSTAQATGYTASYCVSTGTPTESTTDFHLSVQQNTHTSHGLLHLVRTDTAADIWVASWTSNRTTSSQILDGSGSVDMSAAVDSIHLLGSSGNVFTGGNGKLLYW